VGAASTRSRDQRVEQTRAEPSAALGSIDSDLPHEDRVARGRNRVAADEPREASRDLGDHTGLREVRAQQQIGVARIELERRRLLDEPMDPGGVGRRWCAQRRRWLVERFAGGA
jgi:hypothetical protein